MKNRQRAINYVRQRYPIIKRSTSAAQIVDHAMDPETPTSLDSRLTPAQIRRIKHKRGYETPTAPADVTPEGVD